MKRCVVLTVSLVLLFLAIPDNTRAQVKWLVGMRLGISIGAGGETAKVFNPFTGQFEGGGINAGFHFGPTGEVIFNGNHAIVQAININTQAGTPVEWMNLYKYYFTIQGSDIRPYADAGFSLYFITGGPFVSIPFGGGALFPIARNLYIPADLQFGPIFGSGSTVFGILITTGIRYEIN